MFPNHISGVTPDNPVVILIEGLPSAHTQAGAWVGWTTRSLPASRFKIEGYDIYNSANVWRVIADNSTVDYSGSNFSVKIPTAGIYSKLKFTFYNGINGVVGLSELFFIHTEATTPFAGLLTQLKTNWQNNGTNLTYNLGNVGIGTSSPQNKLDVNGTIHSKEVKVDVSGWPDYVFKKQYDLVTLEQVEKHIAEKGHLENIPSEEEVLKGGISLGEMNAKLLQKIEELTLYMIDLNKKVNVIQDNNDKLVKENKALVKKIDKLEKK
ncbi:hypothetical protein ASE21_20895 [Flavobacterium sp. Root901]|uniref:hypothetical protein n=1 Tax=Flavobacterium sp. Root901 TaxID=1736605 RepID=UPI00070E432E|nr:hypothetical protein [Flavobacterium sp. Root901]KRD05418.1 hypothetical protein ASE21_20895 [Flavobacterium sp. Root901]